MADVDSYCHYEQIMFCDKKNVAFASDPHFIGAFECCGGNQEKDVEIRL